MEEYIRLLDLPDEFDFAILKKAYRKKVKIFHPDKAKNDSERVEFEAKMKLLNEANEYLKEYLERHNGKYTKSIENDTTDYSQDNNESYTEETSQEKYEEETQEEATHNEGVNEETDEKFDEEVQEDNKAENLTFAEKWAYTIKLILNPKLLEEEYKKSNPSSISLDNPKNLIIFTVLITLILYPVYEFVDKVMYPDTPKNTQQEVVKESIQEPIQKAQTEVNKDVSENKKDVVLDDTTEIGRYMGNIQQRIKRNWDIPKNYMAENGVNEVSVEVGFTLYKDGNIIGKPKIIRTSGLDIVDKRCLEAVELSAPFNPIPSELDKDTLEMTFTFEADRK